MKAWVLWHKYLDGSGAHVERVYLDGRRATDDLALMKAAEAAGASSEWKLDEASVFGDQDAGARQQFFPQSPILKQG